ncbi:sugar transferase [Seonamhaeicola marinus]|uniref:Sugar transferase n=1 Tax=Seonamhaeicola marinus TaxID=1912246 RepID=A0A5D0HKL6_9FLAO|nr:sugar transferase [Seonamhaeicola marinus]TYA71861.1 sugar transferase [Seonamhaeicola marinus]
MYRNFLKRVLDFFLALISLLIFSPIFIVITLVLIFVNEGKPFFTQKRPGKNEKIFRIIKFKSMTDKKDINGNLLPDSYRLTFFGKILRKTSLDEIPQLLNVIKGDMSFIGPRPLLIRYLPYYTEKEKLRHSVRPGITGLAQISGRNFLNWDERLQKDVEYVQNLSLFFDISILFKTLKKVILRKDVAENATAIMIDLDELRRKN